MRSSKPLILSALTLFAAAGCQRETRPPAPSVEESVQLDEAENMLNAMERGEPAAEGGGVVGPSP